MELVEKKFIVCQKIGSYGWDVIRESRKGVGVEVAKEIYRYHIEIVSTPPDELVIVEVNPA